MSEQTTSSLEKLLETFMHRSMRNFIVFLKEQDLSMSHIGALFILNRKGTCDVSSLGDGLGITPAATSQMLNRLVKDGLIQRTEDPQDRRSKIIELTEKGQYTLSESIHARQTWLHMLVDTLDPAEHALVSQAINLLLEKARQMDDSIKDDAIKDDHIIAAPQP